MEALATALKRAGASVTLRRASAPVISDVVVLDSYTFRADDPTSVRARWIAAIDDVERDLAVDLVVDPAIGALPEDHPSAGTVLAGAGYALVGAGLPVDVAPPGEVVNSVLVTLGGSVHADHAAAVAAEVADALRGVSVSVVVGPWYDGNIPAGVTAVRTVDGLGPYLAGADLVVTAAGVTMLEAFALGRPAVVVTLADNQTRAAAGARRAGAALIAGLDTAAACAAELAEDRTARRRLSTAARALVDARGPDRVASEILARCA
jgi:spore coat polysaccharide biosynthesis predicted glycosyltransferase SpsG